jgi:hypothetical protein
MTVLEHVSQGFVGLQGRLGMARRRLATRTLLAVRTMRDSIAALPGAARSGYYRLAGREVPMERAQQRHKLIEFYDDFEGLVDLVCASARSGITPGMAADYEATSARMRRAYPPLRSHLLAYLQVDVSDSALGLRLCGRATDAIECLFCAPDLRALHAHDDGEMMGRVVRARDALYRFGDHLRNGVT